MRHETMRQKSQALGFGSRLKPWRGETPTAGCFCKPGLQKHRIHIVIFRDRGETRLTELPEFYHRKEPLYVCGHGKTGARHYETPLLLWTIYETPPLLQTV